LLASRDATRDRLTVRRTIDGVNRYVLHLHARSLSTAEKTDQTDQTGQLLPETPKKQVPDVGRSDATTEKPASKTGQLASNLAGSELDRPNGKPETQKTCEEIGQFGRSDSHHVETGEIKHKYPDCTSTRFWEHRFAGLHCSECWPCTDVTMKTREGKIPTRTESSVDNRPN
jgi:hypothetical protein